MIGHVSWELVASLGNVELTTTGKKLQPIAAASYRQDVTRRARIREPGGMVDQRATVVVTGSIRFFTTCSPILRPMSWPTRTENR